MTTNDPTPGPAPVPPLPDLPRPAAPKSGCLRWGLLGCGVLSAVLIVGLVAVGMKARSLMEWALVKMEDQTLAACTPDVTPAQRGEFQQAFAGFIDQARAGKVPVEKMSGFRTRIMAAVADGKVTPEELTGLTAAVREAASLPAGAPAPAPAAPTSSPASPAASPEASPAGTAPAR